MDYASFYSIGVIYKVNVLLKCMQLICALGDICHSYEPFKCPGENHCISIQYLCDGAPDCADGYDEDSRLCTAGNNSIDTLWFWNETFYMCIFFLSKKTTGWRNRKFFKVASSESRTKLFREIIRKQSKRRVKTVRRCW